MSFMFFGDSNSDKVEGKKLLQYYFDAAKEYSQFPFATLDDFINSYGPEKSQILLESLGRMSRLSEMNKEEIIEVMEEIADKGEGKIPVNPTDFSSAIADEASKFNILDTMSFVAAGVKEDLSNVAMEISDTVRGTLKVAKYLVPAMLFAGLGFWIYTNAKRFSLPRRK